MVRLDGSYPSPMPLARSTSRGIKLVPSRVSSARRSSLIRSPRTSAIDCASTPRISRKVASTSKGARRFPFSVGGSFDPDGPLNSGFAC